MSLSQIYLAFIGGTLIFIMFALSLIMFLIHYKRKQNLYIREKVEMEHQYESQLLKSRLEVQEHALKNFSEEIHDNIGQVLSTAKNYMHKSRQHVADPAIAKDIDQSTELLKQAITDLRNISHTLNGTYITTVGLNSILEKELGYTQSSKGIDCKLEITGQTYPLGVEKELLVFRIIQESIANAVKHGKPRKIEVRLDYQPQSLHINITDDGEGFDPPEAVAAHRGIGLGNIQLRASLLNGDLDIISAKGKGTTISLHINIGIL